jgi:hypothetical protein
MVEEEERERVMGERRTNKGAGMFGGTQNTTARSKQVKSCEAEQEQTDPSEETR